MEVKRLVWDEWNVPHIARHGITPDQVEEACRGRHITLAGHDERIILVGSAGGNLLTVILGPSGKDAHYVVTARPSSRKERAYYRDNLQGEPNADEKSQ